MILRFLKRFPHLLPFLLLIGLSLVVFRVVLPADMVIQSNDYNYGLMAMYKAELPDALFSGFWRDYPLLGRQGTMPPGWNALLLSVMPLDMFMDWIYPLHLMTASVFLYLFLLRKGCSRAPAILGVLTAYWLGSNLTLILPGHLEKYAVLAWASIALYAIERLLETPSIRRSVLVGGCIGMMFMQQADLALFFGLMLGAYLLFGVWTRAKRSPKVLTGLLLPLLVPLGLMMWESYHFSVTNHIQNVSVLQSEDSQERWDFLTQWSWPPQETIDLIAPGFLGWYSGHPEAPYHGIMGQAPAFDENGVGQINFKLESQYLGILPLAFAGFAILYLFRKTTNRCISRTEGFFWFGSFILLFLLSCGKFTPLYRIIVQLPLIGSIRNPNKFLQVFQVVAGLLAAFGLEQWKRSATPSATKRYFTLFLACVAAGAGLGFLFTDASDAIQIAGFRNTPWEESAVSILANRQRAWLHLALFATAGAVLTVCGRKSKRQPWVAGGICALCMLDVFLLGPQYLKPYPTGFLKENPLASKLESILGNGRVAMIESGGIYQLYQTHLFPTRGIPCANIAVAPRLSQDYQSVFQEMVPDPEGVLHQQGIEPFHVLQGLWIPMLRHPDFQKLDFQRIALNQVRFWQEFGVSHVLARRQTWEFLKQWPGYSSVLEEEFSYRLQAGGEEHLILKMKQPGPRARLIGSWKRSSGEEVLQAIRDAERPFTQARIQTELPIESISHQETPGEVLELLRGQDRLKLEVSVTTPSALLRISERYSPHVRVWINEEDPIPLLQTDILYGGVILPQGVHQISIGPDPFRLGVWMQWSGIVLVFLTWMIPVVIGGLRYVMTSDENEQESSNESS